MISPWGICIQWAREVEGGSWLTNMLLEQCMVGHRSPDASLRYAFDLFLFV